MMARISEWKGESLRALCLIGPMRSIHGLNVESQVPRNSQAFRFTALNLADSVVEEQFGVTELGGVSQVGHPDFHLGTHGLTRIVSDRLKAELHTPSPVPRRSSAFRRLQCPLPSVLNPFALTPANTENKSDWCHHNPCCDLHSFHKEQPAALKLGHYGIGRGLRRGI